MEQVQLSSVKYSPSTISKKSEDLSSTISLRNGAGFTLVELMLYVGISSILLMSTSFFMSALLTSRVKNQTIAEVDQQGMQVMHVITQALRNASTINSPAQGASGPSLSLNTYTGSLNPTIFNLSGGVISITEGVATPVALNNSRVSVSALTFYNLSRGGTPGTIRVQFTLSYINNIGRSEYNYSKVFIGSASLRQP